MKETEIRFASQDGVSNLRALVWEPDGEEGTVNARGIIQILHGMAEHIERYRPFAEHCAAAGFIVCAHDMVGHGKSVESSVEWGVLPPHGMNILIEDAHQLRHLMQERFCPPSAAENTDTQTRLPYILFGHSMGSFVVRNYLALHSDGLAAAIICGTGHPAALLSNIGTLIARILHAFRGNSYRSKLLTAISVGAYSKQIENARTPLDWLSTDAAVVEEYRVAPDCGFPFATGANSTLFSLTSHMVKRRTIQAVPEGLPLLFIAGEDDPVGAKGAGVKQAVALFKDTGHTDVTLTLYPGMRHELLNEVDKEQVYQDILGWIEEKVSPLH